MSILLVILLIVVITILTKEKQGPLSVDGTPLEISSSGVVRERLSTWNDWENLFVVFQNDQGDTLAISTSYFQKPIGGTDRYKLFLTSEPSGTDYFLTVAKRYSVLGYRVRSTKGREEEIWDKMYGRR